MNDVQDDRRDPLQAIHSAADRHGRAALLLAESLIHGLIVRSVLTLEDAVEIVETAADIEQELAFSAAGAPEPTLLLQRIAKSLRIDLGR